MRPATTSRADAPAGVIAARVGRSFLIARLAANALTQRDRPIDPDDLRGTLRERWRDLLPTQP